MDSKGNRLEETVFDHYQKISRRKVRVYDTNGKIFEELSYDKNNAFKNKTTWKYENDKQGNWIKRTQ